MILNQRTIGTTHLKAKMFRTFDHEAMSGSGSLWKKRSQRPWTLYTLYLLQSMQFYRVCDASQYLQCDGDIPNGELKSVVENTRQYYRIFYCLHPVSGLGAGCKCQTEWRRACFKNSSKCSIVGHCFYTRQSKLHILIQRPFVRRVEVWI